MLSFDSKMPHLRCTESLQLHPAAEATAAQPLRATEQPSSGTGHPERWSSQPHSRRATNTFLSGLLMQIMVMDDSLIWLKISLSSLHWAVLLCIKELTVNVVI